MCHLSDGGFSPVTIDEYIERNGTATLGLLVKEFVRRASYSDKVQPLVEEIDKMMGDLDSVFMEHEKSRGDKRQ